MAIGEKVNLVYLRLCFFGFQKAIIQMMGLLSEQHPSDQAQKENAGKGTEVFVGGLPRSISEEKILEVFSSCGKIVEIRMIKDQKGNMKGFCFVRFAMKEAASRALREKSGVLIDGKKIGVLPSTEQDTLYFGNLNKAWSADEFERIVLQVFPDILSIDLAMLKDMPSGQRQRNRGFAFVKFSSHAAAARAHRVGSQPDFRLGNLHPSVQWAEEEPDIDPKELAKVKIAFVRGLSVDAEENYLKQLFEPFGKVEKVVVSKKRSSPVGFVHFIERTDLERAIKELNEKTVRGPSGGQMLKLQVEVARPMDKNKKRVRENSESKASVQGHSKLLKEESGVALSNTDNYRIQGELESADPYEDAVIALPLAVKERLLRILRLGIATRYDIDVKSLRGLKELPESIALSVLDQFMLSGAALLDKGAYLASLISKQLDKTGSGPSLAGLPKVVDTSRNEAKLFSFLHRLSPPADGSFASRSHSTVARSDNYASRYSPRLLDYHLPSQTLTGRVDEKGSDVLLSSRSRSASQSTQIPRTGMLDERDHTPFEAIQGPPIAYERVGLRSEERHPSPVLAAPSASMSYARLGPSLGADITAVPGRQASRPQIRFDPFTGEPYKFDPFTGEPIHPGHSARQF